MTDILALKRNIHCRLAGVSRFAGALCVRDGAAGARECNINWIREGIAQCRTSGVKVFIKQLGKYSVQNCDQCGRMMGHCQGGMVDACGPTHAAIAKELGRIRDGKGGNIEEFPQDLRIREFPD